MSFLTPADLSKREHQGNHSLRRHHPLLPTLNQESHHIHLYPKFLSALELFCVFLCCHKPPLCEFVLISIRAQTVLFLSISTEFFFSSNWISISWFLCLRNLDKILPGILLQHFALLEIQYLPKMRGDEVISLRVSPSSGVSYAYSVLYQCEREFVPASTYRLICTAVV